MTSAASNALSSPPPRRPRPFLKWAGGKTQLVHAILERFPSGFKRYHEPFIGGGAVFFALGPERARLSDVNADLVNAYIAIRDDVEEVITELRRHAANEKHYYKIRAQNGASLSRAEAAARTIYLNRTCYNGLYRVNSKGQFNVPFGRYVNPTICAADNLRLAAERLQGVSLHCQDVFSIGSQVKRGDLVYFDPPYDPISSTASFTAYTSGGFDRDAQARLAELFRRLAERGVHVVLSNSNTQLIRELYRGFRIDTVYARRAINSQASRRGPIDELLITSA